MARAKEQLQREQITDAGKLRGDDFPQPNLRHLVIFSRYRAQFLEKARRGYSYGFNEFAVDAKIAKGFLPKIITGLEADFGRLVIGRVIPKDVRFPITPDTPEQAIELGLKKRDGSITQYGTLWATVVEIVELMFKLVLDERKEETLSVEPVLVNIRNMLLDHSTNRIVLEADLGDLDKAFEQKSRAASRERKL